MTTSPQSATPTIDSTRDLLAAFGEIQITAGEFAADDDPTQNEVASSLRHLAYVALAHDDYTGGHLRNAAHALVTSFNDYGDTTLTGALAVWDEFGMEVDLSIADDEATRALLVGASEGE